MKDERYYYNSTILHLHGSLCKQLVRCNVSRLYCATWASLHKLFEKTFGDTFVTWHTRICYYVGFEGGLV
jgi:hypothetical protein